MNVPFAVLLLLDSWGELKVVKANIEVCREAAPRHNLSAVPTFVLYRGGRLIGMTKGFGFRWVFTTWLDSTLGKA